MRVERKGEVFDVADFPTDDDGWFWRGFQDETWEPDSFDILDRYLTPESTFVDIGAWIGPLTLWAARLGARVVAVEPDPVALPILVENASRNGGTVDVYGLAISRASVIARLAPQGHGADAGEFGNSMSHLADEGTPVFTLSPPDLWDQCQIENVALVKIDIEAGEARLVEAAPFLRQFPLLLALHGPWMSPEDQDAVSVAFDCDAHTFGQVFLPAGM